MRCSVALTAAHRSCRLSMTRMKPTPEAAMLRGREKTLFSVAKPLLYMQCVFVTMWVELLHYLYDNVSVIQSAKYIKYRHLCITRDILVLEKNYFVPIIKYPYHSIFNKN